MTYSTIPLHKFADCDRCGSESTPCKKRKKELLCFNCCKIEDVQKQISKAKARETASRLRNKFSREHSEQAAAQVSKNAALTRWFNDRRKEMNGVCAHCGGRTEKHNDATFKCSIAHILPKAYFKSVAMHPLNWIELCFYKNSCHTNFDNKMLDIIELNCFDTVIERFIAMYPDIAQDEKRRIPIILLNYVKYNT